MAGRVEWVHEPTRFAALAEDWEELARDNPSPFADHAWFQAWWEAFGSGRLAICLLWESDRLQAALPLFTPQGRLRPAGSAQGRLVGLANYHTPLFAVPARDANSLAAVIEEALKRPGAELTLQPVDASDALCGALRSAAEHRRRLLLLEHLYRSPRVEVSGEFDTYAKERGSRFKDLARRWRKLNREHETRFRFEDGSHDLEADLERGYKVEAAGWKGEQGTAILSSPQTRSFYTAIARAYQRRDQLRLIWLEIDDRPAAFSFCLLRAGRLYCLKTGIDDALRRHSPGLLIDYCTIQRCFDLELETYELLGAEEAYKEYFATTRSDHVRVRAYRRRPAPVARYLTRRLGRPLVVAARQRGAR